MRHLFCLSVLSALLTACGGDITDPAATPAPTATPVATATPAPTVQPYTVSAVSFDAETENVLSAAGDVDDPAIWVHPSQSAKSLVVTAIKDGGMRVYDLQGQLVQSIGPGALNNDSKGKSRYNNVDIVYGFKLDDNSTVDLAIATDRGQDLIRVWKIDPNNSTTPLSDITSATPLRLFPTVPTEGSESDASKDAAIAVSKQNTGYGITHFSDKASGKHFVLVNQRKQARIRQFELIAEAGGTVNVVAVAGRDWRFPYSWRGQNLRETNDLDATRDWSPQFEGMVVDQRNGMLYAGQEDVGIWRVDLKTGQADTQPVYETRGSSRETYTTGTPATVVKHSFFNPESKISRDLEGLSIYYGPNGTGYLIASSQGGAHGGAPNVSDAPYDDSFAVFALNGNAKPVLKQGFRLSQGPNGNTEGVQECDGADVVALQLPGYPFGLLVTQDGYNDDLNNLDGVTAQTNLKFTSWEKIATALKLEKYNNFDPRKL
ncbi:phytase [Chitinibacter sp. ZOR0017]|uniref:phytase n=1 Tax=Chitinibacter sp. ZOR0017 TaxID=1339254 RepID=UPI00064593D5|nr:phytase [Chitinibacter sp. ZOR0017]